MQHNLKAIHNKDYSVVKTFKGALSLLVIGFFSFLKKIGKSRRKSDGADKSDKADWKKEVWELME